MSDASPSFGHARLQEAEIWGLIRVVAFMRGKGVRSLTGGRERIARRNSRSESTTQESLPRGRLTVGEKSPLHSKPPKGLAEGQ